MSFLKIRKLIKFSLFTFLIILPVFLNSQTELEEPEVIKPIKFDPLVDNIADKLPPLQILIDSAVKHSPRVRLSNADISIMKYNLKNAKINWTRNLGFMGELLTGNYYQFSTNQSSGASPNEFVTDRYESNFFIGIFLKIPISDVIGQKNHANIAKRELEKKILLKEENSIEIRKEVIMVYQELLMRQELLKIKNESQLTTRLQVQMAEIEFKNGSLKISEMARLTDINAENLYENRQETFLFYRQYLILEELVGMKFNLINEIE
jgi:outer membrane protein TolC